MFGISQFTAIINPPQSCILAVGGVEQKVTLLPEEDVKLNLDNNDELISGTIRVDSVMKVTMSCDHRVVDGALGAQFLQTFKNYIEENPLLLLAL